ncbi:MAG: L-carnitine dehydratase/bile acid-inducible protein [Ramlibacter sp.]|nr:L-carnitine dehydratase/bile acid-inducible protein [Ramlibacter sp.]
MLEGVKILSFTHYLQGPSTAQMLADLGADVKKIESPGGNFERHWSGFDAYMNGVSVFFMLGNRNSRSIAIDLRTEAGKDLIYRFVKDTDVVVENFRPGVMDRLGFGYERLKQVRPDLVYCSCTGYGSDGPYRDRPGQDLLLQSMSGMTMLTGGKDAPPTPLGTAAVDQHAAVLAAMGVLAALVRRAKTGVGCKVESNLLNAALDMQIEPFTYYLNKGPLWERSGSGLASTFHQAPYGVYQTLDGWITLSMSPADKLAKALGNNELAAFTPKDQFHRREEINRMVVQEVRNRTTNEWFAIFAEHGIWYAPVNTYAEVERDPQVEWNNVIAEVDHPEAGKVRLLNHPVRYDGSAPPVRRAPPLLGEHTREILAEYGVGDAEIDKLVGDGVVVASPAAHAR